MTFTRLISLVALTICGILSVLLLIDILFLEKEIVTQSNSKEDYNNIGVGVENPLREIRLYHDIRRINQMRKVEYLDENKKESK